MRHRSAGQELFDGLQPRPLGGGDQHLPFRRLQPAPAAVQGLPLGGQLTGVIAPLQPIDPQGLQQLLQPLSMSHHTASVTVKVPSQGSSSLFTATSAAGVEIW